MWPKIIYYEYFPSTLSCHQSAMYSSLMMWIVIINQAKIFCDRLSSISSEIKFVSSFIFELPQRSCMCVTWKRGLHLIHIRKANVQCVV